MKKIFFTFFLSFFLFPISHTHAESILTYQTWLELYSSGDIKVKEFINWDFDNQLDKRGIIREIPLRNVPGSNQSFEIKNFSVQDEQGTPYNFFDESDSRTARFKIGQEDVFVSGIKSYNISYDVLGGLGSFKEYTELYFNVIGTEWTVPIENAYISIMLPEGVTPLSLKVYCGEEGSREECATSSISMYEGKNIIRLSIKPEYLPLQPYYGVTTAIAIPRGHISSEATLAQIKWREFLIILSNLILLLPIPLTWYLFRKKFARRKRWKQYIQSRPIVAEYDSHGLSPLEVERLHNETNLMKNISAEILWLATEGFLTMEKNEAGKVKFIRVEKPLDTLFPHQLYLLKQLQDKYDHEISSGFYIHTTNIHSQLLISLADRGYFLPKYAQKVKKSGKVIYSMQGNFFTLIFLAINPGVFFWIFGELLINGGWRIGFIWSATCVLSIIPTLFFGRKYNSDFSPQGLEARWRILGLRHYIKKAEAEKIAFSSDPENSLLIAERLLPYAMVFGFEKKWIAYLQKLLELSKLDTTTHNYHASRISSLATMSALSNSFASTSIASHAASVRSSSRSSGSSSGSSGGGGGGGGGSSW